MPKQGAVDNEMSVVRSIGYQPLADTVLDISPVVTAQALPDFPQELWNIVFDYCDIETAANLALIPFLHNAFLSYFYAGAPNPADEKAVALHITMKKESKLRLAELVGLAFLPKLEELEKAIEQGVTTEKARLEDVEAKRSPKKSTIGRYLTGVVSGTLFAGPIKLFVESATRILGRSKFTGLQSSAFDQLVPACGSEMNPRVDKWVDWGMATCTEAVRTFPSLGYVQNCMSSLGKCLEYSYVIDSSSYQKKYARTIEVGNYLSEQCATLANQLRQCNPASWSIFATSSDALNSGQYDSGGWYITGGVAITAVLAAGTIVLYNVVKNLDQVNRDKIPVTFSLLSVASQNDPQIKYLFDTHMATEQKKTITESIAIQRLRKVEKNCENLRTTLRSKFFQFSEVIEPKSSLLSNVGCSFFRLYEPKGIPLDTYEVPKQEGSPIKKESLQEPLISFRK